MEEMIAKWPPFSASPYQSEYQILCQKAKGGQIQTEKPTRSFLEGVSVTI